MLCKLGDSAGCIFAKSTASLTTVRMSSFESELETYTMAFKSVRRVVNTLKEMEIAQSAAPELYNDNKAMMEFVRGEGNARGARHMELRMFYCREQYAMGNIKLLYMGTEVLPADSATKASNRDKFEKYADFVLGKWDKIAEKK